MSSVMGAGGSGILKIPTDAIPPLIKAMRRAGVTHVRFRVGELYPTLTLDQLQQMAAHRVKAKEITVSFHHDDSHKLPEA